MQEFVGAVLHAGKQDAVIVTVEELADVEMRIAQYRVDALLNELKYVSIRRNIEM
jgi:hypothetical protein